jgi:uncharacterized protein YrrD
VTVLLKAADLVKRPVVTLAGEDVGQIKDVVYSSQTGELAGFTLNGRGLFSGPLRKTLPWENVHGLGPAAVMIHDESQLADRKALSGVTEGAGGAVLGSIVITQSGRRLGVVTDVILAVGDTMTDAVGYEIDPADSSAPRRQFVPLPDTLAVSGEALMLPDAATEFIRDDLAGFGAAVEEFRNRLRSQAVAASEAKGSPPADSTVDSTADSTAGPAAEPGSTDRPEASTTAAPQTAEPRPAEPRTDPERPGRSSTKELPIDKPTAGEQK